MIFLRNLTSSAPWEPRFFRLDHLSGEISGVQSLDTSDHATGLASGLITFSAAGFRKKVLAIFMNNSEWFFFDGIKSLRANEVRANWQSRLPGFAELSLDFDKSTRVISYIRPWLRHSFEGGWKLEDVDIGFVINKCLNDDDALSRMRRAFLVSTPFGTS
jgi:hypothetical protein